MSDEDCALQRENDPLALQDACAFMLYRPCDHEIVLSDTAHALAVVGGARNIVLGDDHLISLGSFREIKILTVASIF
ncbi:hypothetical protein [Candidatus Nitrososphaera evergladensis]|uniref:hypothetical protein n=1 Tax=Candidatus Nitrososphaera evergladensis TaxID=1459637 RepID=UPI0011E5B889|nr:hypothetical protein [Candidatus Nitrososphaera evergladensis]